MSDKKKDTQNYNSPDFDDSIYDLEEALKRAETMRREASNYLNNDPIAKAIEGRESEVIASRSIDIPLLLVMNPDIGDKYDIAYRDSVKALGQYVKYKMFIDEIIPFKRGNLQESTSIDTSINGFTIGWHPHYSEERYMDTSVDIKQTINKNATYRWFDGYLSGDGESNKIMKAYFLESFFRKLE